MFDRRSVSAGLLGAALTAPAAAARGKGVVPGAETWSESVMVLYFDEDLRNGFSIRLSRYPERDVTWVWVHVLVDGVLYAFTDRAVPCSPHKITAEQRDVTYPVPGLDVHMTRTGTSGEMGALSFSAVVRAHKGTSGVDGPGDTPVVLEGVFHPGPLLPNSPKGRFEHTGRVEATLKAGGRTVQVAGVAKAHEQTQTAPRFDGPFTYGMIWGPTASMIGLLTPKSGGGGDLELDGKALAVDRFKFEAWAPTRRFVAVLKDGTEVSGSTETLYSYQVPIFGKRQWYGRILKAEVQGHRMVGMINDWKPEEQPYGLS